MTPEKLSSVFKKYRELIASDNFFSGEAIPQRMSEDLMKLRMPPGNRPAHMLWMCDEAQTFVVEGRIEKAMRWLGFIQGWLWTSGRRSLDDLKKDSMPDVAENG